MATDYNWLSTSLFCSREHWHVLLKKGIKAFLNIPTIKKRTTAYQVKFNYNNGENIRFSLLTSNEQAMPLVQQMDLFFKEFFQKAQFSYKEKPLSPESIFCNFPPNTIQYGLYRYPAIINLQNVQGYYFETKLSQLLIRVFSEGAVDEDKLLTIAFYLHIVWLKMCMIYQPELTIKEYATFYTLDTMIQKNVTQIENASKLLHEIYSDIMDHRETDLPGWLQKWANACMHQIRLENKQQMPPIPLPQRVTTTIVNYLALPANIQTLLFYGIRDSLQFHGSLRLYNNVD